MDLLVVGHGGARVIVFPTRVARLYDYENMGMIKMLWPHLESGWLQLYCLDSIDHETFYCSWSQPQDRIERHLRYENYVLNEVLPLTRHLNGTPFLISHGCSFGAYHAMNIALRHPGLFNRVVALSGRYNLTSPIEDFRDLLDGYYDEDVYFNMPSHYMPNIADQEAIERIRRLDIKMVVGENDPFLGDNRHLSQSLWDKGIWHLFRVWSGRAHGYRRWREMVPCFL